MQLGIISKNQNRTSHEALKALVVKGGYNVRHRGPLRISLLRTQEGLLDTSRKTNIEKKEFERAKGLLEGEIFDSYNFKTENSEGIIIDKQDDVLIPNQNKIVALIKAGADKEAMLKLVEEKADIGPLNSHIWSYYDTAEKILGKAISDEYFSLTGIKRENKVKERRSTYRC